MRKFFSIATLLVPLVCYSQEPATIDLLHIKFGGPFPIDPAFPAKPIKGGLPSYSIVVPMPEPSPLNVFFEYRVDIMFDTGNVFAAHASRTFRSMSTCTQNWSSVKAALMSAFHLKPINNGLRSMFEGEAGDIEAQVGCNYPMGSPYTELSLYLGSKSGREHFANELRPYINKDGR